MMDITFSKNRSKLAVLFFAGLIVFAFVVSFAPVDDPDVWWHIRTGQYIIENHTIPDKDIYSHTAFGHDWITHEWLAQIILFFVHSLRGPLGIKILNSIFAVLALAVLWRFYKKSNVQLILLIFAVLIIFPDFLGRLRFRPDIFSLVLTVLMVDFLFHLDRRKIPTKTQIIVIAIVAAVWSNLHSVSLIGLFLFAAFTGGELLTLFAKRWLDLPEWRDVTVKSLKGLAILTLAYGVGVMATPNLYKVYSYIFLGSKYLPGELGILEWQSPFAFLLSILKTFLTADFRTLTVNLSYRFIYLIIPIGFLLSLPVLAKRQSLPTLSVIILTLVAIYISSSAVRFRWLFFIPVYWLATGLSFSLPRKGEQRDKQPVRYAALLSTPLILLIIGTSLYLQLNSAISFRKHVNLKDYPEGLCNFLEDVSVGGNLFNSYNWGGYLIYRLTPQYKVFIDGRTILYSTINPNLLLDHVVIEQKLEGYNELLEDYDIDVLISKGKIYFPGEEMWEEYEFSRQRRASVAKATSLAFTSRNRSSNDVSLSRFSSLEDSVASGWTLLMANREGSVYLNKNSVDSTERELCENYFKKAEVSFSWDSGISVEELIIKRPDLAVRYNIIPPNTLIDSKLITEGSKSDMAVEYRLNLAESYFKLGLLRDAADLFDEILDIKRYEYRALYSGALTHHILGENDIAFAYLEKVIAFGQTYPAMRLMEHCREHQPSLSKMKNKLPDLEELILLWDQNGYLSDIKAP